MESKACKSLKDLAPQVGLEPTTLRLTAECSTIELLRSNRQVLSLHQRLDGSVNFAERFCSYVFCTRRKV